MPKGQAGGGKEVMGVASQVTRAHERTILFCVEQEALGRFCHGKAAVQRRDTREHRWEQGEHFGAHCINPNQPPQWLGPGREWQKWLRNCWGLNISGGHSDRTGVGSTLEPSPCTHRMFPVRMDL